MLETNKMIMPIEAQTTRLTMDTIEPGCPPREGEMQMEVKDTLRGWPLIKVGTTVRGKVTSIKIQNQKQKEDDHHAATFHKKIHQKRIAPKGVHRERWVPDGDCEGVREAVLGFQVEEIYDGCGRSRS
jgi:hypothetical protein